MAEMRSRWPAAVGFVGRRGAFVGAVRRAVAMPMRRPGASCVVVCPLRRMEASTFAVTLCLVVGWDSRSVITLIASTGGWPMWLILAFGLGAGSPTDIEAWK